MTVCAPTDFPEPVEGLSFVSANGAAEGQGFDKLSLVGFGFGIALR